MKVRKETPKKGAPAYIVSFSALMTIMLTFFILMCAMANEQEAGLVAAGTGSFVHNINSFGLPGLLPGHRHTVDLGDGRPQFAIPEHLLEEARPSDANILYRRVISIDPARLPRVLIKHFEREDTLRIPLDLEFNYGSAQITPESKRYLRPLLARLRMVPYRIRIEAHVGQNFLFSRQYKNPWQLSSARAAAIARFFNYEGGISFQRMEAVGHGNAKPLVKKAVHPSAGERVELVILK